MQEHPIVVIPHPMASLTHAEVLAIAPRVAKQIADGLMGTR
jgi:hypothetical protein